MTSSRPAPEYRSQIYRHYTSKQVLYRGGAYHEGDYRRWADAAKQRLEGWLPADRTTPILDLGCGQGNLLFLLEREGYTHLWGIDISPEQVALARQWCPTARVVEGDVQTFLAQNSEKFGLVCGLDILEHFDKAEILPLLDGVYEALLPGGRLILQTPNAESPWFGSVAFSDFTHEWFFTPAGLERLLRMAGFADFAVRECGPHVHGLKSAIRWALWKLISLVLKLWNLAETGGAGSGMYTRVFICSAIKPSETIHPLESQAVAQGGS